MTSKKLLVSLVAVLAVVISLIANVSAFTYAQITDVEVNGVEMLDSLNNEISTPVAVFAGQTIPVRVIFDVKENAKDVRVKAWIAGESETASVSERFDALGNNTYTKVISVKVPSNLKELDETLELHVVVENRNDGTGDEKDIPLTLERESYIIEILDASMPGEISAGDVLIVDVVLKNRGRQFAEDTFATVSIPALGIEDRAFFDSLASIDEPFSKDSFTAEDNTLADGERLNKESDGERILSLRIPSNAPAGLYAVEIKAYNDDSETTVTKKLVIRGAEANTIVEAPVNSKSFGTNEKGEYSLVLVNSGNQVRVFQLVIESQSDLSIDVSDPIVALPAGTSKTVTLTASASKAGTYNFAVNVHSGAELIKRESFTANVEGSGAVTTASPAVLLTIVLAVIFVVLLIVLIVLLTRKPEKSEELGESYY